MATQWLERGGSNARGARAYGELLLLYLTLVAPREFQGFRIVVQFPSAPSTKHTVGGDSTDHTYGFAAIQPRYHREKMRSCSWVAGSHGQRFTDRWFRGNVSRCKPT
jgi:hypothetical protein